MATVCINPISMTVTMLEYTFVLIDTGEFFRTGCIVGVVSNEYYLVQFDNMSGGVSLPAELVHLDEMTLLNGEGHRIWQFFTSEEHRGNWLTWLESPETPKVVSLVKK